MKANFCGFVVLVAALWPTAGVAGEGAVAGSQQASGGELRKFEKSVQAAQKNMPHGEPRPNSSRDSEEDESFGEALFGAFAEGMMEVAFAGLAEGGRSSLQRIEPGSESASRRDDGEILIPFLRYDYAAQHVSSDISARIHQFEGGFGPVALFLEDYTFSEQQPASTLKIKRHLLLYRMSANHRFELDIGAGQSVVEGWQRTGIGVMSFRGRYKFDQHFSIDFAPTWGDGMDDYELALHVGRQYGSLKIGYRSLQSPDVSLSGPFAGAALYF